LGLELGVAELDRGAARFRFGAIEEGVGGGDLA
jgi:hypothetical protein